MTTNSDPDPPKRPKSNSSSSTSKSTSRQYLNGHLTTIQSCAQSTGASSEFSMYSYPEMKNAEEWVKLNVGGHTMISTRTTLTRYSNDNSSTHFLAALVSNHNEMNSFKDENGAYLIDRSPTYFKYVIDFLRTSRLDLPHNDTGNLLEGILAEAEFCNLQPLIKLCNEKIEKRDLEAEHKNLLLAGRRNNKVIYRVLQSSNHELTQMISTLSESWHLEQIILLNDKDSAAGHSTGSNNGGSEYLVVVSQEQTVNDQIHAQNLSNSSQSEKVKLLSGSLSNHNIRTNGNGRV